MNTQNLQICSVQYQFTVFSTNLQCSVPIYSVQYQFTVFSTNCFEILGASIFWSPKSQYRDYFTFTFYCQ